MEMAEYKASDSLEYLTLGNAYRFYGVSMAIFNDVTSLQMCHGITKKQWNWNENMSFCLVRSVPADGLATLCARKSADTMMTKFGSCLYTEPALKDLV